MRTAAHPPLYLVLLASLLLAAATCSRPAPESDRPEPSRPPAGAGSGTETPAGEGELCGPSRVVVGVNDQGSADPELVSRVGLGRVRVTLPWREIQPARDTWRWEAADAVVRPHHRAGHRVLAILSTAPEWAGSDAHGTLPPDQVALWSEYVARVAGRYRGEVDAYEIWNEPDRRDEGHGVGWDLPPGEHPTYAEYLRAAAVTIREHAPGTKVVAPGLGSDPRAESADFLRRLEAAELAGGRAADFVDVVSIHGNARGDEGSDTVWDRIDQQLAVLVERAPSLTGKPVWITELGWPSGDTGEAEQAEKLANLLERIAGPWGTVGPALDRPLDLAAYCGSGSRAEIVAFVYKLQDGGGESRGLYREDGTPKPAVEAVRARPGQ
jgi:hypothetical protein